MADSPLSLPLLRKSSLWCGTRPHRCCRRGRAWRGRFAPHSFELPSAEMSNRPSDPDSGTRHTVGLAAVGGKKTRQCQSGKLLVLMTSAGVLQLFLFSFFLNPLILQQATQER